MIDMHCHIVPGVDDGAKDMEMSIEIARLYANNGFKKIINTSHFLGEGKGVTRIELEDSFRNMNNQLIQEDIDLEVLPGNELYLSMDIVKDLESGRALTLNNSKYVLVELPANDYPLYTEDILYELQIKGYKPIIAHPERNRSIIKNPELIINLISKGNLVQMNYHSIEGMYGKEVMRTADFLLKNNLVHFLGTDTHSNGRRSPNVSSILKLIQSKIGKDNLKILTLVNPSKVINNQEIDVEVKEIKKKTRVLNIFNIF